MVELCKRTRFSSSVYVSAPATSKWALFPLCTMRLLFPSGIVGGVACVGVTCVEDVGDSFRFMPAL